MKTEVQSPMEIFYLPQHLVVPLFQRPYVWSEDGQWQPLWQDLRRLAELKALNPHTTATHFLGAVVLQVQELQHGHIPSSNIIDGQQRLTTLQILMDATAAVLEERGFDVLASQLDVLTHNQPNFVQPHESRLKVRHTNRDHGPFDEVMSAEPPVRHAGLSHATALITRAHEYFARAVSTWLDEGSDGMERQRADALVLVLTRGLQLVVINLGPGENSQEIFETLNARGTPLTAADLIKNFVFQRLDAEGSDTTRAYAELWPFDTKFWETETSVGRYFISRSSLFLNQWLTSRLGEEIGPQSTFTRFKSYVELDGGPRVTDLLPEIKMQADLYEGWITAASQADRQLTAVEMAIYRMQASGLELLKPLLIWLHSTARALPPRVVNEITLTAESWVMRRQLLGLTTSDLGRIVADLIRSYRDVEEEHLAEAVRGHLSRLDVSSTYWPGDREIRGALSTEWVYRKFRRSRLRMILEAVEDRFRSQTNQPQVSRRGFPIEHVLPQKWDTDWPVEGLEAEQARSAHVHRLGNLTLVTSSLNSRVSNGPWSAKRDAFREHDTILLTSRLLTSDAVHEWDEQAIDERTSVLIDNLLAIWPVPDGHVGAIADPQSKEPDWVEVKHLVIAGLLSPGTRLTPRPGKWAALDAVVSANGTLLLDGKSFDTPSGAARHLRGGATNGWYFWRLDDGRSLRDVRSAYRGDRPKVAESTFDWSQLHAILDALPLGRWTSYGAVAEAVGTAAQPVGTHIMSCARCSNAHRVLRSDGAVAQNFTWNDAGDERDPEQVLRDEGVVVTDGRAAPGLALRADDLLALLD